MSRWRSFNSGSPWSSGSSRAAIERPGSPGARRAEAAALPSLFTGLRIRRVSRFRGSLSRHERRASASGSDPMCRSSQTASNVLDIGCGRGELLELFRDHGVTARGIDTNQAMVDECRSRGLDVERADALTFLRRSGGRFARRTHRDPGRRALRARVPAARPRTGLSEARPGRAARARNDQPGVLDGVLRDVHPRSHARASTASRHAALSGSGERIRERQHRISRAGDGRRSARSRRSRQRAATLPLPPSPRPSTPTPTSSTRGCFRRWTTRSSPGADAVMVRSSGTP